MRRTAENDTIGPAGRAPAGRFGAGTLNSLYFGIGLTIILALLAALVGPLFVDWTAYRAAFEERATEILGHPVRVTGTADATLLPVPELVFTGVAIGPDPTRPLMTVGRFEVEVELFPLLSGEFRITRMQLDQPELTLRVDGEGALDWIAEGAAVPVDPNKVVFDRVDVTDGSVRIVDERRADPIEITGVNATIEGRSLLGPYKFDGGMVVEGEPVLMRLSTGTREASGSILLKAALTPASSPVEIAVEGMLSAAERHPAFDGSLRLRRVVAEGEPVLPWAVEAEIEADADRLRASEVEFRYGPEDRPFAISGAATVDLSGEPSFEAVLSARQIDLDRTLGAGPGDTVAFDRAIEAVAGTLQAIPLPPIPGRVGFDIPGIVVGGSLVQAVRLDLQTAADGWLVETLNAALPGRTTIAATGKLSTRPTVAFEGMASLASEQPATLLAWWYPERERTQLAPFDARAGIEASASGLVLSDLDARLGDAALTGDVAWTPTRSERNARLDIGVAADQVPIDQLVALGRLAAGGEGEDAGTDVVLRFTADRVLGQQASAEGVDVAASLVGGTLTVERFFVRDLAGARVSAEGAVRDVATAPDGSLQGRVSAERLDGLADLVGSLAPGSAAAEMLATAAPVLVPASLDANVTAARVGDGTNARIELRGNAGGSSVDAALSFAGRVDRWHQASIDLALDMSGPSGVRLMRQLGFDVPDVPGAGVGRLAGSLHGVPEDGLDLSLDGALGTTTVRLSGEATLPELAPPTALFEVALASEDVGPILALGGDLMSDLLASTPVDLVAEAAVEGSRVTFRDLAGTVDGERVAGTVSVDTAAEIPAVRGEIATGSATLEGLLDLALGPGTTAMPIVPGRNPWPEAPFGPTFLDGIDTDLEVSIGAVETTEGLPDLDGMRFALRSSAAGIGFDGIDAGFAGGRLGGSLVVKRDLEGQAAVSGTLTLSGADAATLAWRRGDLPVVTGSFGTDLEFNASGRTVAGLVSTLAGGGTFQVTDGVIRSFNPQAFDAVIRAADAGQAMPEDRIRAVFTDNIDAGALPFERIEGAYTLAAGVLRAPSIVVASEAATTTGSAVLDIGRRRLESDWTIAVAAAGDGASPPQVDVLFRGPISDPERRIDATTFSSWLGIRAFEQETERVLVLQADILERELLSRQVLRTREAADRRARAEEEARRRAEEEAAARAAAEAAGTDDAGAPAPPVDGVPEGRAGALIPPPEGALIPPDGAAQPPDDDFADVIGRRLEELMPDEPAPAPPPAEPQPLGGPLDLTPPTAELLPPSDIERLPLPPPPAGDASLPGVNIPPPPL